MVSHRRLPVVAKVAAGIAFVSLLAVAQPATSRALHASSAPSLQSVGIKLATPSTLGTDGSFQVQIVGKAGSGTKICAYQVERYTTASGWTYVGQFSGSKLTYTDSLIPSGGSYEYAMRVQDCNHNWSGWTYSLSTMPTALDDNAFTYNGPWQRQYATGPYGGSEMVGQTGAQASVTLSFYNFGLVSATQSSGFGSFKVYVDGTLQGKAISTKAFGATRYRQILSRQGSSVYGTHTITMQVVSGQVPLDALVVLAAGAPVPTLTWTERSPPTSPGPRTLGAMAYDDAHSQTILFGGSASSGVVLADTWAWSGTNWTQLSPASSPPPRYGASMAYDSAHGQLILFGGYNGTGTGGFLPDTWAWDGSNWTQLSPAAHPLPRFLATMAYDSTHRQTILFGGVSNTVFLNDTWAWDGTNWAQLSPTASPSVRSAPAMAYDSAHGKVVLFGGFNDLADTWTWDGSNWTQLSPASSPSARFYASMAYDTAHGQVTLFGGVSNSGPVPGDTWAWNGASWTQLSPALSPSAHYQASMAYDSALHQTVLFGGSDNVGSFFDTFTLSGP